MSPVDRLIAARSARARNLETFGVDLMPGEPWSYETDDPSYFIHVLCEDIGRIKRAESDFEAVQIYEAIRPFIETFHVGFLN